MRRIYEEVVPLRHVAENMGIGAATVFDILEKIKFKFLRNKKLMYYLNEEEFELDNLNL